MRGPHRYGTQRVILPEAPGGGSIDASLPAMAQEVPPEVLPGQPNAQPPPGWPYGDPPTPTPPPADEPPRRVSRRFWYLFGTGLIVLGVVLMIVFIGIAVTSGLRVFSGAVDVRVPGQSQVDLPPDDEKMVWARPGDSRSCTTIESLCGKLLFKRPPPWSTRCGQPNDVSRGQLKCETHSSFITEECNLYSAEKA